MGRVIVIEFVTLDGVVQDPDGADGTPYGGWAFRHGPQAVAGDKFGLGELMDTGALLLGRRTWEKFAALWPARDDPFSLRMNAMTKLVASRTLSDASAWANSRVLAGDLADEVAAAAQDLVVAGSIGVARTLMARGLVDEYRLLVFPPVAGAGERLWEAAPPAELRLAAVEAGGADGPCSPTRRRDRPYPPRGAGAPRDRTRHPASMGGRRARGQPPGPRHRRRARRARSPGRHRRPGARARGRPRDTRRAAVSDPLSLLPEPGEPPRVLAVGEVLPEIAATRRAPSLPVDVTRTIESMHEVVPLDVCHVHDPFAPSTSSAALRHSRALNVGTFHVPPTERIVSTQLARRVVELVFGRLDARLASYEATAELLDRAFPADYGIVSPGRGASRRAPRRRATAPCTSSWPTRRSAARCA